MRVILLLCFLSPLLTGQDLLYAGPAVDAFFGAGERRVGVQAGRDVFIFSRRGEGPPVLERGSGEALGERLPGGTVFYDLHDDRLLLVSRGEALLREGDETRRLEIHEPFFRRPWKGAPLRVGLLSAAGPAVVPDREGFRVLPSAKGVRAFPLRHGGAVNLGWGLGDDMVVTSIMAHVLFRRRPAGKSWDVLGGSGARYRLLPAGDGGPLDLAPAPFDEEEGILEIPYGVPPRLADVSGDGEDDLLLCDPSAGTVVLYTDLDAPEPAVSRVIKTGGIILAFWTGDLAGDHRSDLCVLRLPPMTTLLQLRVVRRGRVQGQLMTWVGGAEGLGRSPDLIRPVTVLLKVAITNGIRRVILPQVLQPLQGGRVLVVEPDGSLYDLDLAGREPRREQGRLPLPGRALDPFRSLVLPGNRVVFGWKTEEDERVYCTGPTVMR